MKKLIFIIFFLLVPILVSGEDFYVQSVKAQVKSEPSFSAQKIGVYSRGEKLNALEVKGDWIMVKFGDNNGWISKFMVSKNPIIRKVNISEVKIAKVSTSIKARRRASTYTTAAAARGLSEERARTGRTHYKADYRALDEVETFEIENSDLINFMKDGGLEW